MNVRNAILAACTVGLLLDSATILLTWRVDALRLAVGIVFLAVGVAAIIEYAEESDA